MHRAKIMPPPALLLWALVAGCRICRVDSFSFSPMGIGIRRAPCSAATFYASTRSSISNRFHGRSPLALPFVKSMAAMASGASGESSTTVASSTEGMVEYPSASDGEALQSLFSKQCSEGLMTEDDLRNVPAIKDMLVRYTKALFMLLHCTVLYIQKQKKTTIERLHSQSYVLLSCITYGFRYRLRRLRR